MNEAGMDASIAIPADLHEVVVALTVVEEELGVEFFWYKKDCYQFDQWLLNVRVSGCHFSGSRLVSTSAISLKVSVRIGLCAGS